MYIYQDIPVSILYSAVLHTSDGAADGVAGAADGAADGAAGAVTVPPPPLTCPWVVQRYIVYIVMSLITV